jgi:hypothetical protein
VQLVFRLLLWAFVCVVPFYLYTFQCFYGIVKSEKPEWLEVRGSSSILFEGLPRTGDPNVQVRLLRLLFSSRVKEIQSPLAFSYVKWARFLLCIGLAFFVVGVAGGIASAP